MKYLSGEEIRAGDIIRFHGEPGRVESVVTHKVGDAFLDCFIDKFPGGVVTIEAQRLGNWFLVLENLEEGDLEFVSRCAADPEGVAWRRAP